MSDQSGLPDKPEYHGDIRYAVSWASRRRSIFIGTPAFAQHLVYWIPDNIEGTPLAAATPAPSLPGQASSLAPLRKKWVEKIDQFVDDLCLHLSSQKDIVDGFFRDTDPFSTYQGRYQTARLRFNWHFLPVELTLELHHEYFTLSSAISLQRWDVGKASLAEPIEGYEGKDLDIMQTLKDFDELINERYKSITQDGTANLPDRRGQLGPLYRTIYEKIWREFYREVFSKSLKEANIGRAYADARGFIISRAHPEAGFMLMPDREPKMDRATPAEPFDNKALNEAFKLAHALLPFMRSGVEGVEHSFSSFIDGHCIYATALGAQPPELGDEVKPITYLMLASHEDRWQLGLLVDQINTLGTSRLAALYDLQRLNKAADNLHDLEQEIEKINKRLPDVAEEKIRDTAIREITGSLLGFSKNLTEAAEGKLNEKDKGIVGGLPYRVERSRDYRRQFDDLVTALRIDPAGRVGGFQPYDEIVSRRLGGTYDFISTVGLRYDRLQLNGAAITQQLRAAEALRGQEQLKRLQRGADKVFFLFVAPYYINFYVAPWFGDKFLKDNPNWSLGILSGSIACGAVAAFREELWNGFKAYASALTKKVPQMRAGIGSKYSTARETGRMFLQSNLIQAAVELTMKDIPQDIHRGFTKAYDLLKSKS